MMLITFGIHLYEICTKNVFLICLVYFQNYAAIKKKSHYGFKAPVKCETKSKRNETKRNKSKRNGIIQNEITPILMKQFLGEIQDKN
jgi:hypothetical protein